MHAYDFKWISLTVSGKRNFNVAGMESSDFYRINHKNVVKISEDLGFYCNVRSKEGENLNKN